ncbi:U-BOX DOMAIN-CONTAINING PROTEIN 42-RELATED [Salix purpurea]|uniref:RING-type E3 ubiquitin transferase n=1 Tax=Salix purpurea TaxID=77065 RepID=A0A9Q0TVI9_SALPP|nr:U-BOX DOMAIN-CONTAINING PROTEIN 42-RELATED [Salix purpurea]KAJ6718628.1 U-BOX DOMAIN-CONTAINING PROTEIN 42-RELATED [Salix purpurea]
MSLSKDSTAMASVAESLLTSISEIIESVTSIEQEKENFAEIGCYLYRVFPVIMELQTTEHTPKNVMEILHSLSESITETKYLVSKCQRGTNSNFDSELKSTISLLERAIQDMGECLTLIPSSAFQDQEYAEVAVQALSNEMRSAHFEVGQSQVLQTKELDPHKSFSEEEPNEEPVMVVSDLYPVTLEVSRDNSLGLNTPHFIELQKPTSLNRQRRKSSSSSNSSTSLLKMSEYVEPMYGAFFCPLTKQIMDDPVTVQSGVTYDRKAITEWLEESENSQEIFCPVTGQKLLSRVLRTNVALKTTIEEWKERNEVARIKCSRSALVLSASPSMVLDAIRDLHEICKRKQHNKIQVLNAGILPLLFKLLEYRDRDVSYEVLELIRELTKDDDDSKMVISEMVDISAVIKMVSSGHQPVRHAALLILLDISRSQSLWKKIGSDPGGILMLIRCKYNLSVDAFSSEKADEILQNLERSPQNIKLMAENGFLEPLLKHLIEGAGEMQTEMADYLGEIALGQDSKTYVAERASPALIKMVRSGNTLTRSAAFKVLAQISSYHPNAKILAKYGIIQIMVEEMLARRIVGELINSKSEAVAILANLFEAGLDLENLQVNSHGRVLAPDYVLYNIIDMIKHSTPDELNINLIRVLLCLTKSPKSMGTMASMVKEIEASYTLVELLNNPHEELGVVAIKLLIALIPYMGHSIVERLCRTEGQPENLILGQNESGRITQKQAVSAKFLAKLPRQNLTLNLTLLRKNTVPAILQQINQIQRTGMRTSRYATPYLEGLVGILVRFTTTLYEPQILFLARKYNFTSIFTEMLMKTSCDEVQRLSAIGLENLSLESINLSKAPEIKKTKFLKSLLPTKIPIFQFIKEEKTTSLPGP